MRRYRPLPAVVFAIVVSALVGGLFGRSALATDDKVPEHYKSVHRRARARSRRTTSTRSSPTAWSTARSAACSARSIRIRASSTRSEYAQMRERQEGRYYGLGITIQVDRRRHHRDERVRRIARVQEGHPPRRRHREDRRRGREGLDDRAGDAASCAGRRARRCRSSIKRRGYEQLIPIDVDARRGQHPDRARVLHDRRDDRLHPACRTSARTPIAT